MATAKALSGTSYTEVVADVTALTLIQCPASLGNNAYRSVELVVAANAPAGTVRGVQLNPGETITSGNIADLGAAGKLWARPVVSAATDDPVEILTL
jgi:hypothetical protein